MIKTKTVTKKHIRDGQRFNPHWCPVALALREEGWDIVGIGMTYSSLDCKSFLMGRSVSKWLRSYDQDGKGESEPITLAIDTRARTIFEAVKD